MPITCRSLAATLVVIVLGCTPAPAPDEPARDTAPGVTVSSADTTFRAHGQEPGWVVAVFGEDSISYLLDYGEWRFSTPAGTPTSAGDTVVWRAAHDTLAITMQAVRTLCTDAMRGDSFPAHVTLTLGSRTLDGCGRWPTEPTE